MPAGRKRSMESLLKQAGQVVVTGSPSEVAAVLRQLKEAVARLDDLTNAKMAMFELSEYFRWAVDNDVPLPLSAYKLWGSKASIRNMATFDGVVDWKRIGCVKLGKKLAITPSNFKAAIKSLEDRRINSNE